MGKTARNERRKLKASWYNSLSSACVTVGMLSPAGAYLIGALKTPMDASFVALLCVIFTSGSAILHFIGQDQLKELED
jgi:hypothetical protein